MSARTKKLYWEDAYRVDFEARVVAHRPLDHGIGIVLDQTCFFAAAGGQLADRGWLNEVPVTDVVEKDGEFLHIVDGDVPEGPIAGKIDWQRRFRIMQQHSGQHILSQSILRITGCGTLFFRMNEDFSTVEIESCSLDDEQTAAIENAANMLVFENRRIAAFWAPAGEIGRYPLRKAPLEKHIGAQGLRIVNIGDYDLIPCGGTHCASTGEVGSIVIRRFESKADRCRIDFLCGWRAIDDHQNKIRLLREIAKRLAKGENDLENALTELQRKQDDLKKNLGDCRERLLEAESRELLQNTPERGGIRIVRRLYSGPDAEHLKFLAKKLIAEDNVVVLFGNKSGGKGQLIFARSRNVVRDMNALLKAACGRIGGAGGGGADFAQGGGAEQSIDEALQFALEQVSRES